MRRIDGHVGVLMAAALVGLFVFVGAEKVQAQPIFIEKIGSLGSADGLFNSPWDTAVDLAGNLYVADGANQRVQRLDLVNGTLTHAYSRDANGDFGTPRGITVDILGNVYLTDASHKVHKLTPAPGTLNYAFGYGTFGVGAGQFSIPTDIAVDTAGDLYVMDSDNDRVQVFSQGASTLNYLSSYSAGGALSAPGGLTMAGDGTLYVVDSNSNRVWSALRIGAVLGTTGSASFGINSASDVAVLADGTLYVSFAGGTPLRTYTYTGSTVQFKTAYNGPGFPSLQEAESVTTDDLGNIYIVDRLNHQIVRLFDPAAIKPGHTGQLANLLLGASGQQSTMTLPADRGLEVFGSTVVEPSATMTILSANFTTQNLGVFGGTYNGPVAGVGALTFLTGTLKVTDAAGLTIGAGTPIGTALTMTAARTLNVTHALTIDATGTLSLAGGAVTADTLTNHGTLTASGATVTLVGAGNANNGPMNLTAGGLRLTKALTNHAAVTVTDSTLRVDGAFVNAAAGQINLSGLSTLRFDAGATNDGTIVFDDADAIVSGPLTNAGGTISLANNATVALTGVVINNGVIGIAAGSSATFNNSFSGTGSIIGAGESFFTAALKPGGDTTASINIAGDATLFGALTIQIGGPTPGTGYDQLLVGGQLSLGGTLTIALINDYQPLNGETFLIIDAGDGVLANAFSAVNGLAIATGMNFELVYDESLDQVRLVAPVFLPGDTDADGDIDDSDLGSAFANYTGPVGAPGAKTPAQGDTDFDGDIDDTDLGTLFSGYTGPLSPANVPEPATAVIVLAGLARVRPCRKRVGWASGPSTVC